MKTMRTFVAAMLLSAGGMAMAQSPAATPAPTTRPAARPVAKPVATPTDPIAMVKSSDPQLRQRGVDLMIGELTSQPKVPWVAFNKDMEALLTAGLTKDAAAVLDRVCQLDDGTDWRLSMMSQGFRATLMLGDGKKNEAWEIFKFAAQTDPKGAVMIANQQRWPIKLTAAGMHDQAIEMLDTILTSPAVLADVKSVEQGLTLKIKTLVAAGKKIQALSAAKQLYNVSSMAGTSEAIKQIVFCLRAVYPQDLAIPQKFQEEQIAGANPPAAPNQPATCSVLAGIVIEPGAYKPQVDAVTVAPGLEEDVTTMFSNGNLMLLAGKCPEAKAWFERAYQVSNDKQLPTALEGMARVMKAQDGTVGRANAWLLSLRNAPKP